MADRRFPRYALEAAVTLRHSSVSSEGRTKNVSRGGACVQVSSAMPVGAEIVVEMALIFADDRTSEPLALTARVVWSTALDDQHQVGLSFRALTADQARYLDLFLRYLADQPGRHNVESDHQDLFSKSQDRRRR